MQIVLRRRSQRQKLQLTFTCQKIIKEGPRKGEKCEGKHLQKLHYSRDEIAKPNPSKSKMKIQQLKKSVQSELLRARLGARADSVIESVGFYSPRGEQLAAIFYICCNSLILVKYTLYSRYVDVVTHQDHSQAPLIQRKW